MGLAPGSKGGCSAVIVLNGEMGVIVMKYDGVLPGRWFPGMEHATTVNTSVINASMIHLKCSKYLARFTIFSIIGEFSHHKGAWFGH